MRMLSKRTRTRLLTVASILDRLAARIRKYVASRTPKRGPRNPSAARSPSLNLGAVSMKTGDVAADPQEAV